MLCCEGCDAGAANELFLFRLDSFCTCSVFLCCRGLACWRAKLLQRHIFCAGTNNIKQNQLALTLFQFWSNLSGHEATAELTLSYVDACLVRNSQPYGSKILHEAHTTLYNFVSCSVNTAAGYPSVRPPPVRSSMHPCLLFPDPITSLPLPLCGGDSRAGRGLVLPRLRQEESSVT